ncbi:MAG: histidinol-phosphatase [Muribaculaceae bacterium]|nr:histidinol-phosphatase [Muribaculaceae bacterium]
MLLLDTLISDSRLYTLHSHTQFCDGHATMAEFAKAAAEAGFTAYGFSPHSPVPITSPCNMSESDVPTYLAEVDRLRKKYEGRMKVYAAMEIDYLGSEWGPANEYFRNLPLDYRIGSVHFITSQSGDYVDVDGRFESFMRKMSENFRGDIRYVVDTFYDRSEDMVRAGGFDIIGHMDKIGHNASHFRPDIEDEPWYMERVDRLFRMVKDAGIIVEVNTKAWAEHHRMFPSAKFFPRLIHEQYPLAINSDAHYTHLINASRAEAYRMLDAVSEQA